MILIGDFEIRYRFSGCWDYGKVDGCEDLEWI